MPVYCYVCDRCGHKEEQVRPIAERNAATACLACIKTDDAPPVTMRRDLTAEGCWSDNQEYLQPVFSDSMGVAAKQVPAAQKLHPWIKYQPDGRIRIDSPAEYRNVRKALGMVDRRKR